MRVQSCGFSGGYFNFFVWGSSSYSKTTASSQGSLLIPNIHSLFHSSLRYFNWDVKFLEPWWNQFSGFGLKWCLAWIWANTSFVKVSFCLLSLQNQGNDASDMFFCMTNHPQTAMVPARHVVLLTSQRLEYLTTPPTGNLELGCHSDINCYIELHRW